MTVLVVAAHPDDEVLGCGGTIALHTSAGEAVHICILGEGATSRTIKRELASAAEVQTLRDQAAAVADLLGAKDVRLLGLPDNRFDSVPLLDIVKLVEERVTDTRPRVVYTHHSDDLNIDHRITHDAVLTATRPIPGQVVQELYAWESPSATEWSFRRSGAFAPNVFIDISATLDRKIDAMRRYAGEIRAFPHPRSPEALRAAAIRWGSVGGLAAAEPFELIRAVRHTVQHGF